MSQPFFVRPLLRGERTALRKLRKRPPNVSVYLRAQAVHFSAQRMTVERSAAIVDRHRSTVFRWLQDFQAHGLPALWPGKSTGRPPKADKDFQAALAAAVDQNPHDLGYPFTRWSADLLTEHMRRTTHVDVSCSTVYHVLKRLGYRYGCPKLDLKHRQDPKDVARAKRQKRAALKKRRKPEPVVVLSSIVTKPNFTSIRVCRDAGRLVVAE
jgi:transposase